MRRRSRAVNAGRGGASIVPKWAPRVTGRGREAWCRWDERGRADHSVGWANGREVGEDLVGRPLVSGVGLHERALRIDDRRAQVMRDVSRVLLLTRDRHAEPGRELVDFVPVAGEKGPARPVGTE